MHRLTVSAVDNRIRIIASLLSKTYEALVLNFEIATITFMTLRVNSAKRNTQCTQCWRRAKKCLYLASLTFQTYVSFWVNDQLKAVK